MKCKLCKEKESMITTEFCLDCFIAISNEIHKVSIDTLGRKDLI